MGRIIPNIVWKNKKKKQTTNQIYVFGQFSLNFRYVIDFASFCHDLLRV